MFYVTAYFEDSRKFAAVLVFFIQTPFYFLFGYHDEELIDCEKVLGQIGIAFHSPAEGKFSAVSSCLRSVAKLVSKIKKLNIIIA